MPVTIPSLTISHGIHIQHCRSWSCNVVHPTRLPTFTLEKAIAACCFQGCHFDPVTQNIILQKLHAALDEAGLLKAGVQLSASDETSIDTACQSFRSYSLATLKAIAQVNTHAVSQL